MWDERDACSETLIREKRLNGGTSASDGQLRQEGLPENDWTTKYIVFSKLESPAEVEYWLVC